MPIYSFHCDACGARSGVFRKISQRDEKAESCPACSGPMRRILDAPRVAPDLEGYDCPITGKRIEGRRAHEENLARHGCRVFEPGEREAHARRRAAEDSALEERLASSLCQSIAELSPEKRSRLEVELSSGVDVGVVRS